MAGNASTPGNGALSSRPSSAIPFFRDTGVSVPFVANAKQSKELTRGMVWREMYLRLSGQLTCTAVNNSVANTQIGDEWAVVKDLTLRIGGRDVFKRIDGPALRWLQYYLYGQFPIKSLGKVGDATTLNANFDSTLILPFWMPKSSHPMDFAFDTSKVSRIDLEVDWGNYTDINSAATGFTTAPKLDVHIYEVANVGGTFARWNIFPIQTVIGGASNKYQIKVPVGYLYRSFLISDPSEIITNVYLQSHPTEWLNMPVQIIKEKLGLDRRNSIMPGAFTNTRYLAGATGDDLDHYIYFDAVGHGLNVESIDTFGLSDFYLLVDTNGAGTITLYPSQMVVPRG